MAILKADLAYRRKWYLILCAVMVVSFIIIQWGLPVFDEFLKRKKPEDALQILLAILVVIFFGAFLLSVFSFRLGKLILKTGQFPLPGTKVVYDTEILEGMSARRKAHKMIGIGIILGILSLSGATYFPYNLKKVFDNKNISPKSNNGRQAGSVPLHFTAAPLSRSPN
jgi:hypothetical protein